MSVELKRRQFTVKEYDIMVKAGIIRNDDIVVSTQQSGISHQLYCLYLKLKLVFLVV
ncbi:MAG: hypothetical protein QNJ68_18085 [Microcoleaceae cyanobacterium MO_207.B10]|nr:hypothetical protein [Microcoleaceae cyanobacterium MO_207.B10]